MLSLSLTFCLGYQHERTVTHHCLVVLILFHVRRRFYVNICVAQRFFLFCLCLIAVFKKESTYPKDVLTSLRLQHVDSDSVWRLRLFTSDRKGKKKHGMTKTTLNHWVMCYSFSDSEQHAHTNTHTHRPPTTVTYFSLTMTCRGFPVKSQMSPWP